MIVLQKGGAPRGQAHRAQMQGALQRLELLFRPHPAVLFHPRGALGVPYLHRGKVIARERGLQHQAFGIRPPLRPFWTVWTNWPHNVNTSSSFRTKCSAAGRTTRATPTGI